MKIIDKIQWGLKLRICRRLGHKWKFMGRSGMDDISPGHIVYECQRCGLLCHEAGDTGKRETW